MSDNSDVDLNSINDFVAEIDKIILHLNKIDNLQNVKIIKNGLPPLHPNLPSYYTKNKSKKSKTSKKIINGIAFIKNNLK